MRLSSVFLWVSLAANVGLAAWLIVPRGPPIPAVPSVSSGTSSSKTGDTAATSAAVKAKLPPLWQQLDASHDLHALVTQLRAAGFPPAVIRAMISALVAQQFDAERYKIDEVALHTPYWKAWPNSYMDPKVGPALRKLQQEQQNLIKSLLGENDVVTEESKAWKELSYGKLSPEKLDRLTAYLASFNEKRTAIFAAAGVGRTQGTAFLPADGQKLAALDKEMREGAKEFLTPAEFAEYNLRNSNAATNLKWILSPAGATEDEYRTIFPLFQRYFDQTSAKAGQADAGTTSEIALKTLMAEVAATTSPQRAEQLQIALDPNYVALNRLVSRLDLPLTASKQVVEVQRDVQQRAAAVRDNAALNASERSANLVALQQEATKKLSTALGGQVGLDAYKQNGGQWLSNLASPKG